MSKIRKPHLPDDLHDDFEDQLKIISQCPVCDTKFNARQSRILEDRDDAHLVYLNCRKCLNSVIAVIRFGLQGISSIGMVTDLSYDEVLRFKEGDAVSVDDVLDVHRVINKNNWQDHINTSF